MEVLQIAFTFCVLVRVEEGLVAVVRCIHVPRCMAELVSYSAYNHCHKKRTTSILGSCIFRCTSSVEDQNSLANC